MPPRAARRGRTANCRANVMTIAERFSAEPGISRGEQAALNRRLWAQNETVPAQAGPSRRSGGIITGDAVVELRALRDAGRAYDVIIADPPYNIGKDFGNNNDAMPLADYVEWAQGWVADCFDLLAKDGLLYIYGLPEIIARVAAQYPIDEQRWLVWHYTNKTVPASNFWQRSHESILCLWQPGERRPNLEIDQIREPYTTAYLKCAGRDRKETPSRFGGAGRPTVYNAHANGALPRDVIKVPALAGGAGRAERWFVCRTCADSLHPPAELADHRGHDVLKHPTQKPMEVTRRLILSRINGAGGQVLIPFAGSGSECVVAQELGLGFLGIEINPEYARLARAWLRHNRRNSEELQCTA